MPLLPWPSPIPDRRRAGCARDPRECDRRRRGIPGCGGSTSSARRDNDRATPLVFILPPSPPARPIVARPISLALTKAAMRLAELPLVEMPIEPVARLALGDDLADEHVVEADVVADRRDHRDVGDEIDRRERRPARRDRMDEFDRDMRGVAARAAVAHREQPAAAAIDRRRRSWPPPPEQAPERRRRRRWSRASRAPCPRSERRSAASSFSGSCATPCRKG